ncbi:hypothetical protein [Parasitella parasitica]|uniref:Thioesterase domain-containing protein n=1 Tax=Parasitella parasitica TaxID=35722 RepID=A0A0B7N8S0_9FUNG|nr:hypothetical protein [Parasitella parasitica]
MSKSKEKVSFNYWKGPIQGVEFDFEGPSADYLFDMSHLYDRVAYQNIHAVKEEWCLSDESDALSYLPIMKDPLRVTVGIDEKKTIDIPNGESVRLDNHFKYKKGYIINTGGSIWGLDFVPKLHNDADPTTQYLAVAGYKGTVSEHHELDDIQATGTYKNAIQIWKLKLSTKQPSEDSILDMCLLHDFGVIHDLKWCPYGVYEDEDVNEGLPKLGLLAISCGDGTIRIIIVPHPNAVRKYMCPEDTDSHKTLYLRIESSRCIFALEASKSLAISWGGHKKIAAGYTNGVVAVWDVESALNNDEPVTREISRKYMQLSFYCLDSGVRCITWNGYDSPERLILGGYDGQLILVDTNDPFVFIVLSRARSIMHSCSWPGHSSMMLFNDGENMVRGTSLNLDGSLVMGRYGDLPGMCWSIATSEFHGQYASGSTAGYVHSANMYQIKGKGLNSINAVYRLFYNEATNEYRYIDGMGLLSIMETKAVSSFPVHTKTHMAIQRVVWNPNQPTCGFLASGGSSGLCRIEFEDTAIDFETSINEKAQYNIEEIENVEQALSDEEESIQLLQEIRSSDEWEEVEAYKYLTESARSHSLTATTLRGPGMIARRPLKFFNKEKTSCVMFIHFGTNLCGHDGIIHGGLAATVLDEMLAYVTIPSLPGSTGFTANLNVNYRKPIRSDQWVVIRGKLEKLEGRKAWGIACIMTLDDEPVILTEATALYISPRTQGPITNF